MIIAWAVWVRLEGGSTYKTAEQIYPTDDSATLIHRSNSRSTIRKGGEGNRGKKGVRMYMAGYNPSTQRKARKAPSLEINQGIAVGWMRTLKVASVRKTMPIMRVSKPNPPWE